MLDIAGYTELNEDALDEAVGGSAEGNATVSVKWERFGKCLLTNGARSIPELSELVKAIDDKCWTRVADLVRYNPAIAENSLVQRALNNC